MNKLKHCVKEFPQRNASTTANCLAFAVCNKMVEKCQRHWESKLSVSCSFFYYSRYFMLHNDSFRLKVSSDKKVFFDKIFEKFCAIQKRNRTNRSRRWKKVLRFQFQFQIKRSLWQICRQHAEKMLNHRRVFTHRISKIVFLTLIQKIEWVWLPALLSFRFSFAN